MARLATADSATLGRLALSMFNPVHIGLDEFGQQVHIKVIYKNLLAAGEPGGGKSGLLNILSAHAALSARTRVVFFDGKLVEFGLWRAIADEFVGPDIDHAIITLRRLQRVLNNRLAWLDARGRRKIGPGDDITVIAIIMRWRAAALLPKHGQQQTGCLLLRPLILSRARRIGDAARRVRPPGAVGRCAISSAPTPVRHSIWRATGRIGADRDRQE